MTKCLARFTLFPMSLIATLAGSVAALRAGVAPASIPLVVTVVFLFVALVAEKWIPRVARPAEPCERRADLSFVALTVVVDPVAKAAVIGLVAFLAGRSPAGTLAGLPLWAGALGVLLIGGLGDYWAHRFGHQWSWWWKLHAVHHAPHRMVALNNFRLHPVDLALKLLFATAPVLLLGFTAEAIALAGAIKGLNVAFQHADIDLRHGPLNVVFATNSVHRWHHSAQREQANANYGGVLSVFDLLFGTYRVPAEHLDPERMGLFDEQRYPVHAPLRSTVAPLCWRRCT